MSSTEEQQREEQASQERYQQAMDEQNLHDATEFLQQLLPVNAKGAGRILEKLDGWEDLDDETFAERATDVWNNDPGYIRFVEEPSVDGKLSLNQLHESYSVIRMANIDVDMNDVCETFHSEPHNMESRRLVRMGFLRGAALLMSYQRMAIQTMCPMFHIVYKSSLKGGNIKAYGQSEKWVRDLWRECVEFGIPAFVDAEILSIEQLEKEELC